MARSCPDVSTGKPAGKHACPGGFGTPIGGGAVVAAARRGGGRTATTAVRRPRSSAPAAHHFTLRVQRGAAHYAELLGGRERVWGGRRHAVAARLLPRNVHDLHVCRGRGRRLVLDEGEWPQRVERQFLKEQALS